jgi:nitric oxide reductase NorD protein
MDAAALADRLERAFAPYPIPEWELEARAEGLAALPEEAQRRVLDLLPSLWPVSHALTFSFLQNARAGVEVFGANRLQLWVAGMLDAYEAGGLEEAGPLVADGGRAFLRQLRGEHGLRFRDAAPLLLPFARGIAERGVDVAEAREAGTDTATVWLPSRVAAFDDAPRNLVLFKLAAAVQCLHVVLDTYRGELPAGDPLLPALEARFGCPRGDQPAWLDAFFAVFPEPELAARLYLAAATARAAADLADRFPGLAREAAPVLGALFAGRPAPAGLSPREGLLEAIRRWTWLGERPGSPAAAAAVAALEPLRHGASTPADAVRAAAAIFPIAAALAGGEPAAAAPPFEGRLLTGAADARRLARRAEARELFIEAFRAIVADPAGAGAPAPEAEADDPERHAAEAPAAGDGTAAARPDRGGATAEPGRSPDFVRIGARRIEVPEGLRPLVDEIRRDLGDVPSSYLSGVIGAAGDARGHFAGPAVPDGAPAEESFVYDEWDFRRSGFRRSWCSLREVDLPAGDPGAVAAIVRAYRGPLVRIRRAFELMRAGERFVRRQRDGDEIDVDAAIAARADLAAGLPASDRLFIRLVRDARDIAAVFLVDMSSSTEGWVSTAIRESLVLLCEGLESLGDRYAIYGFSGMKRLGSRLYRVKRFDDPYGPAVKGRIAAIGPHDYTRMGPPIRHATRLLRATDARVRLLVVLSDGRPEDYDEYKGDYAVEDTRHALVEAKAAGVHPFCITVDREARDYAAHLYGEVSYAVIDDPAQLPLRIPGIYRALTT